jgi:hypothetical protein
MTSLPSSSGAIASSSRVVTGPIPATMPTASGLIRLPTSVVIARPGTGKKQCGAADDAGEEQGRQREWRLPDASQQFLLPLQPDCARHRYDDDDDGCPAGDDHHLDVRIPQLGFLKQLQPGLPGHIDVGDDQRGPRFLEELHGVHAVLRLVDFIPVLLKQLLQPETMVGRIVAEKCSQHPKH